MSKLLVEKCARVCGTINRAVQNPRTGRPAALKKIPNAFQSVLTGVRTFRELKVLCEFSHENVSRFLRVVIVRTICVSVVHKILCLRGPAFLVMANICLDYPISRVTFSLCSVYLVAVRYGCFTNNLSESYERCVSHLVWYAYNILILYVLSIIALEPFH